MNTFIADDGDIVKTTKIGSISIVEIENENSCTSNLSTIPEHQLSRAQVMRQMINEGSDRSMIKQYLVNNNYDVKNFASEWFRLNK